MRKSYERRREEYLKSLNQTGELLAETVISGFQSEEEARLFAPLYFIYGGFTQYICVHGTIFLN